MYLFIFRITADLNKLHTVKQRSWNGLYVVGGGDKEHLRQIHGNLHIMILEPVVLLRIQHLQKSR